MNDLNTQSWMIAVKLFLLNIFIKSHINSKSGTSHKEPDGKCRRDPAVPSGRVREGMREVTERQGHKWQTDQSMDIVLYCSKIE